MVDINNIDKDKLLHFFWSSVLLVSLSLVFSDLISCLVVVFVAASKELFYDKYLGKGNPELLDFIYSIIPCIMFILYKYM